MRPAAKKEIAMSANPEVVFEKLKTLPAPRLAEVEDFVDFLKVRDEQQRQAAAQRLGQAFEKLDALNEPPMTDEQVQEFVQAEIKAARDEKRAAPNAAPNADRR